MTSRFQALTRPDLSDTSRWVWACLALAVVAFVVGLWSMASINAQTIYSAFAGATPALFAAALMYVAPRERFVRIAAFGFVFPVALTSLLTVAIGLAAPNLSGDYAYLAPRLLSVNDAFGSIGWIFPIIAVWSVAYYIGPVKGRLGWLLVGVGVVIAVVEILNAMFSGALDQAPAQRFVIVILSQLAWIAWAYLLAVAVTRRLMLMSIAALSHVGGGVVSLLAIPFMQSQVNSDPNSPTLQLLLAFLWTTSVIAWSTLILGILRELPRGADEPTPAPPKISSKRSLSAGR